MRLQLMVPDRSKACTGCEKPLEAGVSLVSLLKKGYEREDFCSGCSDAVSPPEELICQWKGVVPEERPERKRIMSAKERALKLLREYVEGGKGEQAYLLALYLERRRVIERVKELKRKKGNVRFYQLEDSDEVLAVPALESIADQAEREAELLEALRGGD